ncbi:MAG: hypothetical protein ABSA09_00315 [Desulfobaccales bacterium]|jgi:tetratricopeptide (TPR) repeat protein
MINILSETSKCRGYRISFGIRIILASWLLFSFTQQLLAAPASQPSPSKEAILQEAHGLINQDNPQSLRKAISLLEGNSAQFPEEVRFPLYLAEAYYRLANPDADVAGEYQYYEKTETYAQKALHMENRPEAHYWYGLALLKKAQKKGGMGAISIVKEGIRELNIVRQTAPTLDHAGASRVLSQLYAQAPRWTPFGDRDKAISLAQEAVRLAPDYPENRKVLDDVSKR